MPPATQCSCRQLAPPPALTKSAKARRQLVSQRVVQCVANDRGGAGGRVPGA
jgi:hypothetical protein